MIYIIRTLYNILIQSDQCKSKPSWNRFSQKSEATIPTCISRGYKWVSRYWLHVVRPKSCMNGSVYLNTNGLLSKLYSSCRCCKMIAICCEESSFLNAVIILQLNHSIDIDTDVCFNLLSTVMPNHENCGEYCANIVDVGVLALASPGPCLTAAT